MAEFVKMNTDEIKRAIEKYAGSLQDRAAAFCIEFIQDINEQVVTTTPYKTGFLRGSWYAALNSPPAGAGTPDAGEALARLNTTVAALQLGDVYYASNGAAYAARIEFGFVGTDKLGRNYNQAPRAWVRSVIDRAETIAAAAAERVSTR